MKPKLLITLGDSWTEGVGCYINPMPYDTNYKVSFDTCMDIVKSDIDKNLHNYHKSGWPNRVGEKLGFNKVINLGYGGCSNSFSVKLFYELLNNNSFENYDVLVIWMMTDPTRLSFYSHGLLENYHPDPDIDDAIGAGYLKEIKSLTTDPVLEQKFYLQSMENICKVKDIYLITTSWNESFIYLHKYYKSNTYLFSKIFHINPPHKELDKEGYKLNYSFCTHPNERGYEWIANKIVEGIKQNHPKWYSETPNENIEWEWKGRNEILRNIFKETLF